MAAYIPTSTIGKHTMKKPAAKATPVSRKQFKEDIAKLTHAELVKVICDLCSGRPEVVRFFEKELASARK